MGETNSMPSEENEQSNIPTGWFNIVGKTGLCVSARNNNSFLVQANCGEAAELLWKTDKTDKGLKIANKTKRQMDAMGASGYGYVKQNTPRQIWTIETVNNGKHVTFRNKNKKCLEAVEAKNNGHYKIVTCDAYSEDQWFSLEAPKKLALPEGWFNIVGQSGLCVAARLQNGSLTQQNCTSRDSLLWKAEEYKNGYVIQNKTERVMYNSGNSMLGYTRNNAVQSIWSIESVMHGKYITFRNIYRKTYCLDDTGIHKKNLLYRTFACSNDNKNQWFLLETPKKTQRLYPEGYFNIIGKSGLCVSSRLNNGNLQQEKCGDLDTLLWTVKRNGDGLYIINKTSRAMDASGATVRGYTKSKTTRQIWAIESVNYGKYVHIRNFVQNKCLDNKGNSGINNLYRVSTCEGNESAFKEDQWFLLEAPKTPKTNVKIPANQWFNLMGTSGLCTDAHSKIGERVTQVKCTSKKSLRWKFVPTKGGYIIKNNNDFVLENKESKKDDKNPIIANKGKKGPNQIWVIELTKANKFIIRNPESNKCFTAEGRQFYILTCDKSSKKQNFELGTPEKNTPANKTVKPAVYPISVPVKETPKTPKTNVKIPENKSFNIIGSTDLCTDAPSKIGERVTQDKCTSKKP